MTPIAPASFQRSRNTTGSSSAPARKVRSIAGGPGEELHPRLICAQHCRPYDGTDYKLCDGANHDFGQSGCDP